MSRSRRDAHKQQGQERKLRPGTYTPILNDVLTDPGISPEATKLLMYLVTKPTTWIAQTSDLVAGTGMSEYMIVRNARPELGRLGFTKTDEIKDDQGRVTGRETRLVRNLVIYVGNGAGSSLRCEVQPDLETVAWIEDLSAESSQVSPQLSDSDMGPGQEAPDGGPTADVSPGQSPIVGSPHLGNPTLLVTTHRVVTTEQSNVSEPPLEVSEEAWVQEQERYLEGSEAKVSEVPEAWKSSTFDYGDDDNPSRKVGERFKAARERRAKVSARNADY